MATKKYVSFSNLTSFLDNLKDLFATKTEMNAKSDKTHTHTISNVTGLQSALDGKASSSHGTHVTYSTTAPVMDGTASVGTASTVSRSDHKHPTDTSRAAQTSLDSHTSNTTSHITSSERTNFTAGYTHSQSAHAPVGAQANIIESVKVNGTALTVTNKSVNVTVPTGALASKSKVSESDLDSTLAAKLSGKADADHNHNDVYYTETEIDTKLSGKANTSHSHDDVYYTETEVDTKLDNKVDKVNGKGLSTNDYTTTEKNKLAGIAEGANKYVLPSATDSVVGGMKLYTSTGTNTAGTMTQKAITDALSGKSGTNHNHDSVYSKLGHTHTAAEVGAATQTYVDNQIKDAKSYTDAKVAGLVDSAPETLNTLNELAAALGDDPNFATTMTTELGQKATKTELNTHTSSNIHITDAERAKWDTHADSAHAPSNAERNIIVGIQKNGTDVSVNSTTRKVNITVPTKTSELTNNSDFATNASVTSVKDELQANIDGKANSSHGNHVPTTQTASNKVFLRNDNTWATVTPANIGAAASSHTHSYLPLSGGTIDGRLSVHGYGNNGGLNLDGYQGRLELRAEIGTASIACVDGTNSAALIFSPNKPVNEGVKFSMKKDSTLSLYKLYGEHNKPTTSDLINDSGYITEDSVPTKVSQLTNDSGYITSSDIPTVPTKVSQLTNDSGYITSASIPTKTSQLTNNSGYITSSSVPTKVSQLTNDKGYITSAVSSLGFSPVQQGGGVGQSTNKVYIGWSGRRLKVTVDQTDLGNIVFDNHVLITQIGNTTTTCSFDYSNDNASWYNGTVTMDWTYKIYSDGSAEAVGISRNDIPVWTCASWGSWHETGQLRIPSPLSFKEKPHVEVAATGTGAWYVSEGAAYVSNTVSTYFCRATENVSARAYLTVHIHGKLA